ncbi:glycerate kinase [Azospirillum sp. RWY-5-1]|uniref:Glycerate kinase n=1 Tax=Azospirillum oleiclasticum TaxID=2735135 RepID=A0ABX2T6Z0_9PROT|nr:glycerate kinase [Azospirillum oleiclasticum]NYZ13262.1 glycerate kinase [Azospirillum oleiclasticum]NYZ20066.1 glycerate kinase [Azospirillum oleiclasticum]
MDNPTSFLRSLFDAAVAAVSADSRVPPHLPPPPKGRTVVVGAGKGAAAMAKAVEDHWDGPLEGLVVTRYDHGLPTTRIEVVEASHPTPDEAGQKAAARILELVKGLSTDDLLLCLISGGGSSLLAAPAAGMTLDDKRAVTKALLKCGASIDEINCVRKHLSAVKGGRLAAATPARVVTLTVSDVPGDDPSVIASGPTVSDPTTLADARAVLAKYGIEPSPAVAAALDDPANETPKPGDPRLAGGALTMIATPQDALEAAAEVARAAGITPLILGNAIEGEAREVARVHAGMALQVVRHGQPLPRPCVLLSGGETTVTVRGNGRGGRNVEFLLGLAIALDGLPGVHAIACDTDGIDGTEDNAGAVLTPDTLTRAAAAGLDAKAMQADNDAYSLFQALGDLVVTGPTRTNVNDFRAVLVL